MVRKRLWSQILRFRYHLLENQSDFARPRDVQLHCKSDAILADDDDNDDEGWCLKAHELASTMPTGPIRMWLWEVGIKTVPVQQDDVSDTRRWDAEYALKVLDAILAKEAENR